MKIYPSPNEMIPAVGRSLLSASAKIIKSGKWQGLQTDVNMVEVFGQSIRCVVPGVIEKLMLDCDPSLPWAEDHFQERIQGYGTNPGFTYKYWPYYKEDSYRASGQFTHTYQERIWANLEGHKGPFLGMRFPYGNMQDVVNLLAMEPNTRQAFLPIWFPEDTGVKHGGRVPCTLGYLFSYREGFLHITYYLRSCDYIRHFKNDVYLACRLLIHFLELLGTMTSPINWAKVRPGMLTMHIESLHIFETDLYTLKKILK